MAKVLNCGIIVSKFELQSHFHFQINTHGKGVNHFILPALDYIVSLLSSYKNAFGIK